MPSASQATAAIICGTVSNWVGDTPSATGSFDLNAAGRDTIAITIPAGRLGGAAANYVCISVQAGNPHPLFDGFVTGAAGLIPEGTSPATRAFPAPIDFVPPQACAYVIPPRVTPEQTDWWIDCGAANNRDARGTLSSSLTAQGWTLCGAGLAQAQWQKGNVRLAVVESSLAPGDYPRFSQTRTPSASCG